MNRFVLTYVYSMGIDWCDAVVPIEADSKEEIYVKLCEAAIQVWNEFQVHSERRSAAAKLFFGKPERLKTEAETQAYQKTVEGLRTDTEFELFGRKFDALNLLSEKPDFPAERVFDDHNCKIQTVDEWFAEKE